MNIIRMEMYMGRVLYGLLYSFICFVIIAIETFILSMILIIKDIIESVIFICSILVKKRCKNG